MKKSFNAIASRLRGSILLLLLIGISGCASSSRDEIQPPNVLFIICDDLNDSVEGFGGHPQAKTPNIDALARSGVRFVNAHSNNPVCGPSRASLWNGLYSHTTGYYGFNQNENTWRDNPVMKNSSTLFEHFYKHGYDVLGTGKIFHINQHTQELFKYQDGRQAFGENVNQGPWAWNGKNLITHTSMPSPFNRSPFESIAPLSDIPEAVASQEQNIPGYRGWYDKGKPFHYVNEKDRDLMSDEISAAWAIEKLQEDFQNPFLMAVGFMRPHCPWIAPKKYFDMFPLDSIELPPYLENDLEDCGSPIRDLKEEKSTVYTRFERLREAYPEDEGWKRFVQGYLACVAFADDQVGKVLKALEESPHKNKTIVVFVGDHGFHMGEKDLLFKRTVWEESTRIPMVIGAPGISKENTSCATPVSLIDCYPTLVDLCGLPENPNEGGNGVPLDGYSLKPLLMNPEKGVWEGPDVALSSIFGPVPVDIGEPGKIENQHFTLRSANWRYVRYSNGEEELYNHRTDPQEWNNAAGLKEYVEVQEKLNQQFNSLIKNNR